MDRIHSRLSRVLLTTKCQHLFSGAEFHSGGHSCVLGVDESHYHSILDLSRHCAIYCWRSGAYDRAAAGIPTGVSYLLVCKYWIGTARFLSSTACSSNVSKHWKFRQALRNGLMICNVAAR